MVLTCSNWQTLNMCQSLLIRDTSCSSIILLTASTPVRTNVACESSFQHDSIPFPLFSVWCLLSFWVIISYLLPGFWHPADLLRCIQSFQLQFLKMPYHILQTDFFSVWMEKHRLKPALMWLFFPRHIFSVPIVYSTSPRLFFRVSDLFLPDSFPTICLVLKISKTQ